VVDPKCEVEPLIHLRFREFGDQIILNQKIEDTPLDLNAGNFHTLDIHARLAVARFDPHRDRHGALARKQVLCHPARRFSRGCLPHLHEVHQREAGYFSVGEFQTRIAQAFGKVGRRLRAHP
jgi:hypothetical protein